ncbi:MAG: T9SS type A sorting domain-containing protein [bacterium]|nr:T9SS type A sorting domain-containing protein [bacterium]
MCRIATICLALCMIVGVSMASVKTDPVTGTVSTGRMPEQSILTLGEWGLQAMAGDSELEALYAEAYARKEAGQDATEIWARINALVNEDRGRNESRLDEGGEDCASAVVITSLPFCDTGNTSDNANDYIPPAGVNCSSAPPAGAGRDVVYQYTPTVTEVVSVSLCGSTFDTFLHIYRNCPGSENAELICCNDDNVGCGPNSLRSCCPEVVLIPGATYYIVVDGWRENSSGDYEISIKYDLTCTPCPCVTCPADAYHSTEPDCVNGYSDETNGGCVPGTPGFFEPLPCNITLCATGGRYFVNDVALNDVDYYTLNVGPEGDSLSLHLRPGAAGDWAMWRVVEGPICSGNVQSIFGMNFAACQDRFFSACLTPGEYVIGVLLSGNIPCGTPYTIDIQCLNCPERCCYRTEDGPACAEDWTREECAAVEGLWQPGLTCDDCCPTDFCQDFIQIPGVYEYTNTANSCCSAPVSFCVGLDGCDHGTCYAAYRAVIYQFTIEDDAIMTLTASGPGDNQIMVFTDCADPTASCVAALDAGVLGGPETITDLSLPAGTYYVATSHYLWSQFVCGEITLHIISDTPLPVELASFAATPLNGALELNWSTGSEQNSSHFNVLRDDVKMTEVAATNSPSGSSYSWTDTPLENGRSYHYALVAVDLNGHESIVAETDASPSADGAVATEFALYQNYPNPFNPETQIAFDLPTETVARLIVTNALGQQVATLVDGTLVSGHHTVTFDGSLLPSGLYFYHLQAGHFSTVQKMILLK